MGRADERFKGILKKLENSEINTTDISKLDVVSKIYGSKKVLHVNFKVKIISTVVILSYVLMAASKLFCSNECVLEMPLDSTKIFREPVFCDICQNLTTIEKVSSISSYEFQEKYVKTLRPVVIQDGALKWPALKQFDFDFFKSLYNSVEINNSERKNCQFFPYKTEFKSLKEVFNMSKERANLKTGEKPWYVGWSNCNDDAGKILKEYYTKPYFLSNISENIALSWIFMGGPGHGAHMHVDNVHYPSWQAQLSGRKLWKLAPPPECLYNCKQMEVIVETGEIIVLDTNRWYHQTQVMSGDISITIGSEFD